LLSTVAQALEAEDLEVAAAEVVAELLEAAAEAVKVVTAPDLLFSLSTCVHRGSWNLVYCDCWGWRCWQSWG